MDAPKRYHSVQLDKSRCKGCTNCLMHCPTEAIRVRDGRAHIIAERCIDCGECIRICDYHAKVAVTDKFDTIKAFRYAIALPAPSLYGQFRNLHPTPQMTSDKGFAGSMWGILFGSKERREPASALPVLGWVSIVLLLPALDFFSLAVTSLLAWGLSLLASRLRRKSLVTVIGSVVFLGAYFAVIFRMNGYIEQLAQNGAAYHAVCSARGEVVSTVPVVSSVSVTRPGRRSAV